MYCIEISGKYLSLRSFTLYNLLCTYMDKIVFVKEPIPRIFFWNVLIILNKNTYVLTNIQWMGNFVPLTSFIDKESCLIAIKLCMYYSKTRL